MLRLFNLYFYFYLICMSKCYGFTKNNQKINVIVEKQTNWDDGEVPWFVNNEKDDKYTDIEYEYNNYNKKYNSNKNIPSSETSSAITKKNREKIWFLLEESKMIASSFTSGALQVVYYNVKTPDNIMTDIENINTYNTYKTNWFSQNVDIVNLELDLLITLITIISYKKNKKSEINRVIENYRSNYLNVENKYQQIKQQTIMFIIIVVLVFTKNIQNAI